MYSHKVTPFAGVWIEIAKLQKRRNSIRVTPFAGVWIEIVLLTAHRSDRLVTPFAGVWIEMLDCLRLQWRLPRHSLRGSVD